MTILLLGSRGMLGSELKKFLSPLRVDLLCPSSTELDLTNHPKVAKYLQKHQPDLIINTVAYTAVDQAETEPDQALALNDLALIPLIEAEIPLITFSSDYVFDLSVAHGEIAEDAERAPVNVYGQSKYAGEQRLEQSSLTYWNLRTAWLYGAHGKNFVDTMRSLTLERPRLEVVADQIGRPTSARDVAIYTLDHFVQPFLAGKPVPTGSYHVQNTGPALSWLELAQSIKEHLCSTNNYKTFAEIIPISAQDYQGAPRPKNSQLKNTKIPQQMPDWSESLKNYLKSNHDS